MKAAYHEGKLVTPAQALAARGGPDGQNLPKGTYRSADGEPVRLHHFRGGEQPDRFERYASDRVESVTFNHSEEDYLD
jgi:hypothetical protein